MSVLWGFICIVWWLLNSNMGVLAPCQGMDCSYVCTWPLWQDLKLGKRKHSVRSFKRTVLNWLFSHKNPLCYMKVVGIDSIWYRALRPFSAVKYQEENFSGDPAVLKVQWIHPNKTAHTTKVKYPLLFRLFTWSTEIRTACCALVWMVSDLVEHRTTGCTNYLGSKAS